jgi:hypothetical protein
MKKSFKMIKRNRRSALGLALVLTILFLQPASASALNLCTSSSSPSKMLCHCCQPVKSSNSRHGKTAIEKGKSAHCKLNLQASSQKFGIATFKKTSTTTDSNQIDEPSSPTQTCCQSGKSETAIPDAIISTLNHDVVNDPAVEIDSDNFSPPLSHPVISHLHSRPVYLFLSSFLI